jgi:DNA-binding FadR family transcriptional regulator
MTNKRSPIKLSEFLKYLALLSKQQKERLPSLSVLSKELGVSVASLREQFEVARSLGLVEARPRTGIRRLPYTFSPAVTQSVAYAIEDNINLFQDYSDLRNHIETAYWFHAVNLLTESDLLTLKTLIHRAFEKLQGDPIQIPHQEHKQLHLIIYSRLNNIFVLGLLEAYWELYEATGLDTYTDLTYLEKVWDYHRKMVEAICVKDFEGGYRLMIEHIQMLSQRPKFVERKN